MIKSLVDRVAAGLRSAQTTQMMLPIFPLGAVLFPGGSMSLKIFETRYMDMAKGCLKHNLPFGICLIRAGVEVGEPAVPENVGTIARIDDWDMPQLGVLQVRVVGETRFRLTESKTEKGLIVGDVVLIDADPPCESEAKVACANFLRKVLPSVRMGEETTEEQYADAGWVAFRVTELLPFSNTIKQKMLELTDAEMRLEILHRFLLEQNLIA